MHTVRLPAVIDDAMPAFAADGLQLATASDDGTVNVWKLLPADQLLRLRLLMEQREQYLRDLDARKKVGRPCAGGCLYIPDRSRAKHCTGRRCPRRSSRCPRTAATSTPCCGRLTAR